MINRHYDNFNIAGFTYYDGVDVFDKLSIGTELRLVPEPENKFDEAAVALYYNEFKLGYIPKNKNSYISKFLNLGHVNLFEVKINQISSSDNPEQQISVVVRIRDKQEIKQESKPEIQPEIKPVRKRRTRVAKKTVTASATEVTEQPAEPKKRRGRQAVKAAVPAETAQVAAEPKKRRGRQPAKAAVTAEPAQVATEPKRRRGRQPKVVSAETAQAQVAESQAAVEPATKRGRGRKSTSPVAKTRTAKKAVKAATVQVTEPQTEKKRRGRKAKVVAAAPVEPAVQAEPATPAAVPAETPQA